MLSAAGEARIEQSPLGHDDFEDVVESFVEQNVRIEGHDHVDAEEQLAQAFVNVEIHRTIGLGVGSGPVEDRDVAAAVNREMQLERAVAAPVIVDIVGEGHRLLGDVLVDQLLHGVARAVEQLLAGLLVDAGAEAIAEFADAGRRRLAACDQRTQIRPVRLGRSGVVQHDVHDTTVENALLVDLDRRDAQTFFPYGPGIARHRAGNLPADIDHMAEDRGEADELLLVEDRQHHAPVVQVRDRAGAGIRIVPDEDIAVMDVVTIGRDDAWNVGSELTDDHASAIVADHRVFVVLLSYDRRQGDTAYDFVHLVARVLERVFNDVEGDRVNGCYSHFSSPCRPAR